MALKKLLTNLEQGLNAYPNHNTPSSAGGFNYGNSTTRIFDSKSFRQKSYKFGQGTANDRPEGGFSNEPFIKNGYIVGDLSEFTQGLDNFTDGMVRGGVITHAEHLLTDADRITQFMISPKGLSFITKQRGLQKTNPMISEPVGAELGDQRTYNFGVNTIASVAASGTGLRFKREGTITNNEGYVEGMQLLYDEYKDDVEGQVNSNRIGYLYKTHILGEDIARGKDDERSPLLQGLVSQMFADAEKLQSTDTGMKLFDVGGDLLGKGLELLGTATQATEAFIGKILGKVDEALDQVHNTIGNWINKALNIQVHGEELYSYNGGPGSLYGIGKTEIRKYGPYTTFAAENLRSTEKGAFLNRGTLDKGFILNSFYNLTNIDVKSISEQHSGGDGKVIDNIISKPRFSQTVFKAHDEQNWNVHNYQNTLWTEGNKRAPGIDYNALTTNGVKYNREARVNMGNPGAKSNKNGDRDPYLTQTIGKTSYHNYNIYNVSKVDKINMLDVFRTNGKLAIKEVRDLVRFRMEMVDTDKPGMYDAIIFRAFLDDIRDNFNTEHNTFKYNGRGEEFYTYNSFKRNISFSFKIAAQSRHEMMPLYRKLNYLVANTAPDYGPSGRMRTPFMRLTIGSWMDRIPGVINSINISWQKDYPWEISVSGPEGKSDSHMQVLPHVLDVNVAFTPVHAFLPEKSIHSPFILSHEGNRKSLKEAQKWYKPPISKDATEALTLGTTKLKVTDPLNFLL